MWIGTLSTLAGAILAALLAWVRDRALARDQHAREAAQRRHEVSERRYEDRRDAYVVFASECMKVVSSTDGFEEREGVLPGDMGHSGPHQRLVEALAMVQIIGPDEITVAAVKASELLNSWAFDGPATRSEAVDAVDAYVRATRVILQLDPPS